MISRYRIKPTRLILLLTPLLGLLSSGVFSAPLPQNPHKKCPDGCWLWLTDEPGFMGEEWVLCGPANITHLERSKRGGDDWDDSIESLHAGPGGRVHLWQDSQYGGPVMSIDPGNIYRTLENAGPGGRDFDSEISSLQLDCRGKVSDTSQPASTMSVE